MTNIEFKLCERYGCIHHGISAYEERPNGVSYETGVCKLEGPECLYEKKHPDNNPIDELVGGVIYFIDTYLR